jgi:hypothetical protein
MTFERISSNSISDDDDDDDDDDNNTRLSFQSSDLKYLSQIIMQLEPNHAG